MKLSDALKLFEEGSDDEIDEDNMCLISKSKIVTNITLPCNHSFEYSYIKPELERQRKESRFYVSKCPYCRYSLQNSVLPFIDCEDQVNGGRLVYNHDDYKRVNILPFFMCSYVAKSGKNKGKKCNCVAHRFSEGDYCYRHYSYIKKSKLKSEMSKQCCAIKRDGAQCTKNVNFKIENNTDFYTMHAKKNLKL